ncbi:TetR/AcrR family transcriptional regulator [Acidocella aquatica]|nr:TetR/AcrR family transcriptional regulator [Acidocella aquatica]
MPRIIDHQNRRQQVVAVAKARLLSHGLEMVTVREVAQLTGYSTAVVSHYFRNKAELMFLIFQDTLCQTQARLDHAIAARLPLSKCLEVLLPMDSESRDTWKIWFAFWNMTLSEPDFHAEQLTRTEHVLTIIAQLIREEPGFLPDAVLGEDLRARRVYAMLVGIAVQATHDPARWPRARQCQVLESELATWAAA